MKNPLGMVVWGPSLASCASLPPPATVISASETSAPARRSETSGSPVIWPGLGGRKPGLIGNGFIAAASQSDGLVVHDTQGSVLQRVHGARLSDLDIAVMPLEDSYSVLMGGPERTSGRTRIVLFRLDQGADQTPRRWGEITTDLSVPAGFCMRQSGGIVHAVIIDRRGETRQFTVTEGPAGEPVVKDIRRFRVSQPGRGCAIPEGGGYAYFSHARQGFWMYRLDPSANAEPIWLRASAPHALPRSTGMAFLTDGAGLYLVTQDEDVAGFSVWRVGRQDLTWLGRFEVREQPARRAVRTLAGIDAYGGELASFPNGLIVVQDQANDGTPNMKYVDWGAVKRALGL